MILKDIKSNRPFLNRLPDFIALARLDRPVGIYLLLWPTLWALWIASEGPPSFKILVIFILGVVLTRSGGCVINDYADRNFDGRVQRTENRPLATGRISSREALIFAAAIAATAFVLVLFTNPFTLLLSVGGLLLAASYPFMKRYTHFPQAVLGAAFAWSIPMAFAAVQETVPAYAWLIYLATLLWTMAYDTYYAMVDREDDLQIGIKSTAILFGKADLLIIGVLEILALLALALLGTQLQMGIWYYGGLAAAALLFGWHHWGTRERDRDQCLSAFLNNHWAGAVIFAGIFLHYTLA